MRLIDPTNICRPIWRLKSSNRPLSTDAKELKSSYDVVVVGGGHNGLITSAYLRKAGYSVCVLERRDVLGGAAVTEEIVPGFKFSRASYVLSLLRPFIISDLKLKDFGLKFHFREPFSSYTPLNEGAWSRFPAKSLLLGSDLQSTCKEIAKFSNKDAEAYVKYEEMMGRFVSSVVTLLDSRPPNLGEKTTMIQKLGSLRPLFKAGKSLRLEDIPKFHKLMTAPAAKILDEWFESEPLKATLATDALIGTMSGPHTYGTGYVLLHHIMGGVEGKSGVWAYPEGGMGAVSAAISASAKALGVELFTGAEVANILYYKGEEGDKRKKGRAVGVVLKNGKTVEAKRGIFSNAAPQVTFNQLTEKGQGVWLFGEEFMASVDRIDYTSPVTKINVAVSCLPNFLADPTPSGSIGHHHKCTIHLNCEDMAALAASYDHCAKTNTPSAQPMIELVIPSSLDPTLTPGGGAHVCLLFTQYTPYAPSDGNWSDPPYKDRYLQTVLDVVERYAPGFKASVLGAEVLSPWDLEQTFGLTGGNIFHGAMSVDQLYWLRPFSSSTNWFPATPVDGLWLCGSGAHPGGGVMGAPGYIAATSFIAQQKKHRSSN